ncbi:hypothetical protein [Phytohabitans suffuscus]|uniref:hypothetical protein n=1 Tax=Phytohabitans suffuscus TaxID=624315 RepID=UPI001564A985|nr:hypothetical protein [Phytohabitans suffuscus]
MSREILLWAAHRIVQQHLEPPTVVEATDPIFQKPIQLTYATGRCTQCPPPGARIDPRCPMLAWALLAIAELEG